MGKKFNTYKNEPFNPTRRGEFWRTKLTSLENNDLSAKEWFLAV